MPYDVVIKSVPKQWIASTREIIPSYSAVGPLFGKVSAALGPLMARSMMPVGLWHDLEYKETNVDAEAGFLFEEALPAQNDIAVRELSAATVASTIHHGSYQRLPEAYAALLGWVGSNNYQPAGPVRELYLHLSQPVRQDDETYVTEIQVPVKSK